MSDSQIDNLYMRRALELAEWGRGAVSPNPMVGCVIVHNDRIIGEGWHRHYGQNHAERNAIQNVADADIELLPESTIYVTLEPCAHFGKQPPCADLLVEIHPQKVVICNLDPNPLVAGKGIVKLQDAGIEVVTGVLKKEGHELNCRFFTGIDKQRPYIVLKWAETADGFMGAEDGSPLKISNALSHTLSHRWRSEEDAILVGTNTALADNPKLNVRYWVGQNPVRVVIDQHHRLPPWLNLFDCSQPTICYDSSNIKDLLADLHTRQIQSVMVEGGSQLLQSFINQYLWDEIRVFKSPNTIQKGITAPTLPTNIYLKSTENLMSDRLFTYQKA
jgi:diaminohydroxyphosphoribosylaminopyrimidine deaminase / 5-amino-6-(5-phosphoribosylamino)uracil reductase